MDKKEQTRLRVQRYRDKQKALQNTEECNASDVTLETVPSAYVPGVTRDFEFLPERPRFLTLSDGQVLDRLNQPEAKGTFRGMREANEAYFWRSKSRADITDLQELINTT